MAINAHGNAHRISPVCIATQRYNVVYNTAGVACRDTSDIKPSGVPQYGEPHYDVGAL